MSSWISFSGKALSILSIVLISISGCGPTRNPAVTAGNDSPAAEGKLLIAVLPLQNISSNPVPLQDIRQWLLNDFMAKGFNLLGDEALESFMAKHRMRYLGGITKDLARDLKGETGADAVLITSVELYSETPPPKISLSSRLVSTGNNPEILWMDGVGLAGDDSIGPLELSLIEDPVKLSLKAVRQLSVSLAQCLSKRQEKIVGPEGSIRFWPQIFYLSPVLDPAIQYTVAVVPFFNLSGRRFAGEFMADHFIRELLPVENFTFIEPGVVRQTLLHLRIIMDDGISMADARALFAILDADLILAGKVFDYQDYQGSVGRPVVDFSALLLEKKSQEVVWSCQSHHVGDDGVFFFDWGKINTAHRMASDMVASALETLAE
jgi:hypothetical protein